jgi:hypothetical protein
VKFFEGRPPSGRPSSSPAPTSGAFLSTLFIIRRVVQRSVWGNPEAHSQAFEDRVGLRDDLATVTVKPGWAPS